MDKKTKTQFRYGIEYELWNKLLAQHETKRAILTLDREIKYVLENEIIERLPTSMITKIIRTKELTDTEVIF